MSNFVLGGLTALHVYRRLRAANCDVRPVNKCIIRKPNEKEVEYLRSSSEIEDNSLSIILNSSRTQRKAKDISIQYLSGDIAGCLVEPITPDPLYFPSDCLLVSPSFMILQLASLLPIEQLLLLVIEFSGSYVLLPSYEEMFQDKKPFLKKSDLDFMVRRASRMHLKGSPHLRWVCRYFCEGAASPMEASIFANLSLPTRVGGYGIADLQMNHSIDLSSTSASIAQQSRVVVDFYHTKSKTVIEYDSRAYHSELAQSQKDKRRRDGLENDNYKCFSITTQQYDDFYSFSACAEAIVKIIKGRSRIRVKNYENKSYDLYCKIKRANKMLPYI